MAIGEWQLTASNWQGPAEAGPTYDLPIVEVGFSPAEFRVASRELEFAI
jgi:hypothetical protein